MKKFLCIALFSLLTFSGISKEKDSLVAPAEIKTDQRDNLKPVEFNREKIEEYKKEDAFDYLSKEQTESWWSRFKNWMSAKLRHLMEWLFGDYSPGSVLSFLIDVLPYLLLLGFFILVIWLFSKVNPGRKFSGNSKESEVYLSPEEELIKGEDLPALMKKAVKDGNFRLAVRYYYLNELRRLDELKIINYEYQKTNHEYFEEIEDSQLKNEFILITRFYEFIWYGSFKVTEYDFRIAEKSFLKIDQSLQSLKS